MTQETRMNLALQLVWKFKPLQKVFCPWCHLPWHTSEDHNAYTNVSPEHRWWSIVSLTSCTEQASAPQVRVSLPPYDCCPLRRQFLSHALPFLSQGRVTPTVQFGPLPATSILWPPHLESFLGVLRGGGGEGGWWLDGSGPLSADAGVPVLFSSFSDALSPMVPYRLRAQLLRDFLSSPVGVSRHPEYKGLRQWGTVPFSGSPGPRWHCPLPLGAVFS